MISKNYIQKIAFIAATVIFLSLPGILFAEVAVLPYKVKNPSNYFPVEKGREYGKMMAVAALVAKENLTVTSPRDIELDLKRHDINPQGTITGENLDLLGRTRGIEYFLLGSLSYLDGRYHSDSVLYSVRDRKVVLRIESSARDLFALAGDEFRQAFARYRTAPGSEPAALDAAFIIDTSYGVNRDWVSVKNAVAGFASSAIDAGRIDTRIYGVPFSSRVSVEGAFAAQNSVMAVKKGLDNLKPFGGPSPERFVQAFRYAVQNVRWRNGASKLIILITNSSLNGARFAEKYAFEAKSRGITVAAVTLGNLDNREAEVADRLATITGGLRRSVAYHQRLFDALANPLDVYLERGRLFTSRAFHREWQEGLYDRAGHQSYFGRPRGFLTEVHYDEGRDGANPGNMGDLYMKGTGTRIINRKDPENNLPSIMGDIRGKYFPSGTGDGIAGRALLSEKGISLWVRVRDAAMINHLRKRQSAGFMTTIGCSIQIDPSSTYGVTLIPRTHRVTADYVPEMMRASLKEIIAKRDYYSSRGLLSPPLWFVTVKVAEVRGGPGGKDVRD